MARNLKPLYWFSLLIAALMVGCSLAGLLFPDTFYPTPELQHSYLANDVFTLLLGLPILLISMWLTWRGKPTKISLIGLLFWPGALLYGLYNYLAYLFGMPFQGLFFLYLITVVLSVYTLIALVAAIDGGSVKEQLNGRVPERLGGSVLILLGGLYILLASSMLISNLSGQASLPQSELAVFVADFIIAPAWVIGGVLLWRRRPLGYVAGTGLLFNASMLFVGVIGIVLLQALIEGVPFPFSDFFVLLGMGLICFIPLGLFIRGILGEE
ncbi:MAG: hypothetical protein ACK2UP_12990 [Candidatus Promineifilaceae bacterium]